MVASTKQVAVAIIGGGVCGVLAAQRCVQEKLSFIIFDRCNDFGGNWFVRANSYSHLQVRIAFLQLSWTNCFSGMNGVL